MQTPWVDVKGFPLVSPEGPSESPLVRPEISHHGADRGVREIELPSDVCGVILLQETNRQTDGPDVRRGGVGCEQLMQLRRTSWWEIAQG